MAKREDQGKPRKEGSGKPRRESPGKQPIGPVGTVLLVSYLVLLTVLTVVGLVVLWPPGHPERKVAAQQILEGGPTPVATPRPTPNFPLPDTRDPHERIWNGFCTNEYWENREGVTPLKLPFGPTRCVYDEDRLLLIVVFAGLLGSLVYGLRSIYWYVGHRRLKWSWSALYFVTPFLGPTLALVFYFVIRGGFFSPTSSVTDTSPFGFAAVAALIGLFTEQAVNKLRDVAGTVFAGKEPGADHVEPAPVINTISPNEGPPEGDTEVTITGDNFRSGATVTFGDEPARVLTSGSTQIVVRTPKHAAGAVDVTVKNSDNTTETAANGFEYKEGEPAAETPPQQPTVSKIEPSTDDAVGGAEITITGSNFAAGASVLFGQTPAASSNFVDASTIKAVTPPHHPEGGVVDVTVVNPDGTRVVVASGFAYI